MTRTRTSILTHKFPAIPNYTVLQHQTANANLQWFKGQIAISLQNLCYWRLRQGKACLYIQQSGLRMTGLCVCVCECACTHTRLRSPVYNKIGNLVPENSVCFWNANFNCQILIKKYQSALFKNWKKTKWWVVGKCATCLLNRVGRLTGI